MAAHAVGGILGAFAVLVGIGWAVGALRSRRRAPESAPTFAALGGPIYTGVQLGCAGVVIVVGVLIMVMMLLGGVSL